MGVAELVFMYKQEHYTQLINQEPTMSSFLNDIIIHSCSSVCSPSPQLPQVVEHYDHQGHPYLERRSRHSLGLDRHPLGLDGYRHPLGLDGHKNKFLWYGDIPMTA